MIPVFAIRKINHPAFGMTTTDYGYITQLMGKKKDGTKHNYHWLADIEEEIIESPETFVIDPIPCGRRLNDDEAATFAAQDNVGQIGYIEDGKLIITDCIDVETAWGSNDEGLIPTRFRRVGNRKQAE